MADLDALSAILVQSSVTSDNEFNANDCGGSGGVGSGAETDPEDTAQHPRFRRNYKNEGRVAASQRQRRQEHMDRRAWAREEWLERHRKIENFGDRADSLEAAERREQRKKSFLQRPNPYRNFLMFSDWLVDIPGSLSTEWTMVPSPVGRRVLVVARNGETRAFFKNGHLATQFSSLLPGGNAKTRGSLTILDGIIDISKLKLYLLDLLWWNKRMYTDLEFTARRFFLQSGIEEMNSQGPKFAAATDDHSMDTDSARQEENVIRGCKYKITVLPSCACSPEEIGQFMRTAFPFRVDGLLFYYNSAFYIPEQTPLVGWLKPWMLPEILGVPVPEMYKEEVVHKCSQEFIDEFNKERGHISSAERQRLRAVTPTMQQEVREEEEETTTE